MDSLTDRERRKQVRLSLRRDLIVIPQRYQGRTHYVVKDPIRLHYYRFPEREHYLLQLLDGVRTLNEVQQEYENHFRPARLSLAEVEGFTQQLVSAGLVQGRSSEAGRQILDRARRQRRSRWLATLGNFLAVQVPLFDPDRLLSRLLPGLRWLFRPWAYMVGATLVLAALLLVATHLDAFRARLPAYHEFFRFQTAIYLWLMLGVVKVLHEFGHGLCCKAHGAEVHDMGLMVLCLTPCLYCNVSDAWMLPGKWQRMAISFAGIYVELILASLAGFVWWYSASVPLIHHLSLSLMMVCSVNTLLFNGNPLMRFDGYYLLADWLEIPNLRERCNDFLKRLALAHGLGIEVIAGLALSRGRQLLFVSYALASYLYRWAMTFSILWFLSMFLQPYRLGAISTLLAGAAVLQMIGGPLYRFGQFLVRRGGRLPTMNWRRVAVSAGLILAAGAVFFTVPLPLGSVRQAGVVQLPPDAVEAIFIQAPGRLHRLHVREGQWVEKGDLLAEFRSLDLENSHAATLIKHDLSAVRAEALNEAISMTASLPDRGQLESRRARVAGERARSARQVALVETVMQHLELRAPRAGVVLGLPRIDEIGKYWDRELPTPFCSIGDPGRLWAVVPIGPADFRLLREELEACGRCPDRLGATVRIAGRGRRTWQGRLAQLPESEAAEVPLILTQAAGGPVAVQPGGSSNASIPQSQQYLVAVAVLDPDGAVIPGMRAQVRIPCGWRTAAWWVWRHLSATFDLGLM